MVTDEQLEALRTRLETLMQARLKAAFGERRLADPGSYLDGVHDGIEACTGA